MFVAVALSGGVIVLVLRVANSNDVPAIRTVFRVHRIFSRLIPAVFGIGVAFGLISVFVEGFNPFAPWLLVTYVLFAAGIAVGAMGIGRWATRVADLAAAAPDAGSPELFSTVHEKWVRYAVWAFWMLIAALVFVMITKLTF
jgi:hypothetical protein